MSNHLGTVTPSNLNMKGQDHQGAEAESVTVPEWKLNMAICKLNNRWERVACKHVGNVGYKVNESYNSDESQQQQNGWSKKATYLSAKLAFKLCKVL